jgi:translocation and assembly module TamB
MLTATATAGEGAAPPARLPPARRIASWIAKALLTVLVALMLAVGAIALLLDTDLGHRLILDRVAAIAPESGLRIRIGRIGGSIWGRTELRDVRLYDPDGLFAEAPQMNVEWQPLAWLWGRLVIHEAASDLVIVQRAPQLLDDDEPTLPRGDVHIGRLDIAQLRFEKAVTGTRRVARVSGEVEYRRGRFLVDLDATIRDGGDRLALLIDAAPDRDEFDLDLALDAPAGGVLAKMLGASRPLRIQAKGDGGWRNWTGQALIETEGRRTGELRLAAASGLYRAGGWVEAGPLLSEPLRELAGPRTRVAAQGRLDEGVLAGRFAARSEAMRLAASGAIDLRQDAYRDFGITVELLRPAGPLAEVASPGTTITALLNGPFGDSALAYRAAFPRVMLGSVWLEGVAASGSGRWTRRGLSLPVAATARSIGGVGDEAAALLAGLRLDGTVRTANGRLEAEALRFASRRARGRLGFAVDLASGRYALSGTAAADAYPLEGIGPADIGVDFRSGTGRPLAATARLQLRRIDNEALARAAGGRLRVETEVARSSAGAFSFANMRVAAPRLQLTGAGGAGPGGALRFEGTGRQSSLGPLALQLGGTPERPRIGLRLARPPGSLGLRQVQVDLEPEARGFAYRARGGSSLGPFSARGSVAAERIQVAALSVSGATATGVLRPQGRGVSGSLGFSGSLSGPLVLSAGGGGQRIEAHLVATDARLGALPIGSGRIDAMIEAGSGDSLQGQVSFAGAADRLWAATGIEAARLSGPLAIEAAIGGSISRPDVSGTLRLDGGRLMSSAAGSDMDEVEARATFDGRGLRIERFTGRTDGAGRVSGSGEIGFGGDLNLNLETDSAQLIATPAMRARVSGPLRIRSSGAGGTIAGDLRLSRARLRFGGGGSAGSGPAGRGGGADWSLAVRLRGEGVEVDGRGLDSRWDADLRLGGTAAAPALTGEANLVDGSYTVLGRAIPLSRGTMRFEGEAPPDPLLDIVTRSPGGLTPAIRITGRASRPEIGVASPLGSRPELPQPLVPQPERSALPARRGRVRLSSNNTCRTRPGSAWSPSGAALPI